MKIAFLAASLSFCSAAAFPAERQVISPAAERFGPSVIASASRDAAHDWPKYCADDGMTGVAAAERSISPATAPSFASLWTATLPGSIASSPAVVGGRVYVGDWSGLEWAFDADTGAAIAHSDLGTTSAPQCNPPNIGITSAAAVQNGVVYVAGGDDGFYALDAKTLETLWKTRMGDNSPGGGYYGWCSPAVLDGVVYQGLSSNCDNPFIPGGLDALDAATGAIEANVNLSQTSDPAHYGAGVWTSPAIDRAAGTVFLATASATHYEDGLAYSVVRLSLADLAVEDFWKIPPQDFALTDDADWGSSPTLFHDSAGLPLVGAGQKNGYYYAFRRSDLADGPVWKTKIANSGDCPQCGNGTVSTAAFDGERLYAGSGEPPDYSSRGAVTALDPATGAIVWLAKLPGVVIGPVSYANGVVFAAAGNTVASPPGSVYAIDADSGLTLWHADLPAALYGGVAISNGRIYFGDLSGNLYCYAVPVP
ncbi:MAG TPA: PQQ-binding-like beta-propeller repeat protein [Thermoanaerobaculia bacterium]|nr:PQQ-binding-like beta-propeller repeat protein [Thermoanaerobaculia bacterium]